MQSYLNLLALNVDIVLRINLRDGVSGGGGGVGEAEKWGSKVKDDKRWFKDDKI